MKEFNLSPKQWRETSSVDKKLLYYHMVMERYYLREAEKNFKSDLPKTEARYGKKRN